jgi:nicotinamidase-related amidase
MRPSCIEGTKGIELDESLDINYDKDYIIQKRRYSAFYGTDLDLVLRENKIENVILTGTKTNCCIRSTVHDAYYNNYNVYVVKECVATNDEVVNNVHLSDIDKYYGNVVTIEEYKKLLKEGSL